MALVAFTSCDSLCHPFHFKIIPGTLRRSFSLVWRPAQLGPLQAVWCCCHFVLECARGGHTLHAEPSLSCRGWEASSFPRGSIETWPSRSGVAG